MRGYLMFVHHPVVCGWVVACAALVLYLGRVV